MRPASAPSPPSRRAVVPGLRARETAHFAVDMSGTKRRTGPSAASTRQDVERGGALGEPAVWWSSEELLVVSDGVGLGPRSDHPEELKGYLGTEISSSDEGRQHARA